MPHFNRLRIKRYKHSLIRDAHSLTMVRDFLPALTGGTRIPSDNVSQVIFEKTKEILAGQNR